MQPDFLQVEVRYLAQTNLAVLLGIRGHFGLMHVPGVIIRVVDGRLGQGGI
jgi:hypothetical protein